jgi:hypothetical protein
MKKYLALAIISLLTFTIIKAPATLLLPYLTNPYLQIQKIEGNIFAAKITFDDKIDRVTYALNPWKLLSANLAISTIISKDNNHLTGIIELNLFSQQLKIQQLTGTINLDLIQQYVPAATAVEPQGLLFLQEISATWQQPQINKFPQQLSGEIEINKLMALGQELGDYQLLINTKSTNIIGDLSNKPLSAIDAKIQLILTVAQQLEIKGKITGNNSNTTAMLQQFNISKIEHSIDLR